MQCVTEGWSCLSPQTILSNFIHDKVHGREIKGNLKHLTLSRHTTDSPPEQLLQLRFTNSSLLDTIMKTV